MDSYFFAFREPAVPVPVTRSKIAPQKYGTSFALVMFMIGVAEDCIFGLVTAYDWDARGNPIKVKICSPGEVDYFVVDNEKGKILLHYLRSRVQVRGKVLNFNSMRVIEVEEISDDKQGE